MVRRFLLPSMLLAAIAAVAVAAEPDPRMLSKWSRCPFADSPMGRTISGCVGRLLVLRSEVNVSAEQKTEIRNLLVSHRSEIATTAKSVRDKRVALRNAVLSGDAEEAQIRVAADELGKAIGDAAVKASGLRNEIAPLLTEDQRLLIREFLAENDAAINKFLDNASQDK